MSLRLAGGLFRTDCVGCAVAPSHRACSLTLRSPVLLSTLWGAAGGGHPTGLGSKYAGQGSITAMPYLRMEDPYGNAGPQDRGRQRTLQPCSWRRFDFHNVSTAPRARHDAHPDLTSSLPPSSKVRIFGRLLPCPVAFPHTCLKSSGHDSAHPKAWQMTHILKVPISLHQLQRELGDGELS